MVVIIDPRNLAFYRVPEVSRKWPFLIHVNCTPGLAQEILDKRNSQNRAISRRWHKICRDIACDNWQQSGDTIKFDKEGNMIDGQHRLKAIAEAGKTVPVIFAFGIEPEAKVVIDDGAKRSDYDIARLNGIPWAEKVIQGANFILEARNKEATKHEKLRFYNELEEVLEWAQSVTEKYPTRYLSSPVFAAIIRAGSTKDRTRLEEFVAILKDGRSKNRQEDDAAWMLREWLTAQANSNAGPIRLERYYKTLYALDKFLRNEVPARLYKANGHIFMLPSETGALCSV